MCDGDESQMQLLREALIEARLVDVGHGGGDFTWYNETEGRAAMWERLDRCVINDRWKELFPDLHVTNGFLMYLDMN